MSVLDAKVFEPYVILTMTLCPVQPQPSLNSLFGKRVVIRCCTSSKRSVGHRTGHVVHPTFEKQQQSRTDGKISDQKHAS